MASSILYSLHCYFNIYIRIFMSSRAAETEEEEEEEEVEEEEREAVRDVL